MTSHRRLVMPLGQVTTCRYIRSEHRTSRRPPRCSHKPARLERSAMITMCAIPGMERDGERRGGAGQLELGPARRY